MSVLVIVESLFGNTRQVADAAVAGLREVLVDEVVEVVEVSQAGHEVPEEVVLLLVGGPTHAFSMSREGTRQDAVREGAAAQQAGTGIREWIEEAIPRADLDTVTFDTRVKVPGMPGSAAKSAAKALQQRGFRKVERGPTFWVEGKSGPMKDGELAKAREWGVEMAARTRTP